jgi:nucleotide-binding universal stress UspA family protein
MFDNILLAIDRSQHSNKAVEKAIELAKMTDGEVSVFHVREVLGGRAGPVDLDLGEEEDNIAEDTARRLQELGVKATGARVTAYYGDTAALIVKAARDSGADVIVMGSRGHSEIPSLLLGSVAHKVTHLATGPVLIVR